MFKHQHFLSLEREKRLLFVEDDSAPEPLETTSDPDFAAVEPGTDATGTSTPERTPIEPTTDAEKAIAAFTGDAEKSPSERIRESILKEVEENTQKQVEALQADLEKRSKLSLLGKVATLTVAKKKTADENLSDAFDDITKKALGQRNESLLKSGNKALHRIAESTTGANKGFIFMEMKCRQIGAYLDALRKQREVYQREQDRFSSLISSLRTGKNDVFAGEIADADKTISQLEQLQEEEERNARETPERQKVDEIKEKDNELRKLLMEENADHFSKANLTQLILQAVAGNAQPLKDAINAGVADPAKQEILAAAADELVIETPSTTYRGSAYRFARDFIRKRRNPEDFKQDKDRQQALSYVYSTQILDTEKQLNADTITKRLTALKDLPVGSRVSLAAPGGGTKYNFTTAGTQKGDGRKEYIILRAPNGEYAAIDRAAKQVTYQKDKFTESEKFGLDIPTGAPRSSPDPTVMYLQCTPTA
jgi:hypothetical protein